MYLCFCIICNLFIYILCYYVSEVILGDSLGRDTSENKGTAPGLSWGAPEKVRDMVFVWLPVLFRSNNISSPKWAYQENQSASIYGKGLWRDPTVCGLNCKIFSCQDYLFTLPLPQKRLSLKRKFCLFVRYHILFLRILQISVFCFLFEKADCSIFTQLFGWSVGVIISFPSPNIFLIFLSLSLANNGTFASGRHNLRSFIAANLTQNYFLIARMLSFSWYLRQKCRF